MGAARFTKTELSRALDAARDAGLAIVGYAIEPDGTIRVNTGPAPMDEMTSQPIDLVQWTKAK